MRERTKNAPNLHKPKATSPNQGKHELETKRNEIINFSTY